MIKRTLQFNTNNRLWLKPWLRFALFLFVSSIGTNVYAQRCEDGRSGNASDEQEDCANRPNSAASVMPAIMMLLLSEQDQPDLDGDGIIDELDDDRDGDGFSNEQEESYDTDPDDVQSSPPDLDGDKIPDDIDDDRDGDGISNDFEEELDTNPDDPEDAPLDSDEDGIPDVLDDDRDGDGVSNEDEIDAGADPDDAEDVPDQVAPELQINNPAIQNSEQISIVVTGVATDPVQVDSGIQTVRLVSDQFPNTSYTGSVDETSGVFSIEVPLKIGQNVLTIIAIDLSGNESAPQQISVNREAVTRFANILPASGTVVTQETITISGEIHTQLAIDDLSFRINDSQITPDATNQEGVYRFELSNVALDLGDNNFNLLVTSEDGNDQQIVNVNYTPEAAGDLPVPTIAIISPSDGALVNQNSFRVSAQIESLAGPLTVRFNGNTILDASQQRTFFVLSEAVSFANNQDQLVITISATDSLGKTNTRTATFYRDASAPVLVLDNGLQVSPAVNAITGSPIELSGNVTDDNLSSLFINDQSVQLSPGSSVNNFSFSVPIAVNVGDTTPVSIAAYDRSGNRTEVELIFENTSTTSINALLPANNAQFIGNNVPITVQVVARAEGLVGDEIAVAFVDGASNAVQLGINGTLASANLDIASERGEQTIVFQLRDSTGTVLSEDSLTVNVTNTADVPVEIIRVEPQNNADFIEPNAVIEVFFNRDIDFSLLNVSVHETLQGKTYINNDDLGVDFINAEGYQLSDVIRTFEPVQGQLEAIPGDSGVSFSASRFFGYNARVFVEITYDGEDLARNSFQVRELPTFINGAIVNQFGQPIAGVDVELPELNRSTTTNGDGGFAFGYQETGEQLIPGGRYLLRVNNEFKNPLLGTINKTISVQQNYPNDIDRLVLQELERSTPFYNINSGSVNNLAQGDLIVDLTDAQALFTNGRTSGAVHAQFLPFEQLGVLSWPTAMPHWMFGMQPKGITIEGSTKLSIAIPKLRGNYDYINFDIYQYVVLLAYNIEGEVLEPIGVGQIEDLRINSVGAVDLRSFDYIGYALVLPSHNDTLESYANGEISLQQLKASLSVSAQ